MAAALATYVYTRLNRDTPYNKFGVYVLGMFSLVGLAFTIFGAYVWNFHSRRCADSKALLGRATVDMNVAWNSKSAVLVATFAQKQNKESFSDLQKAQNYVYNLSSEYDKVPPSEDDPLKEELVILNTEYHQWRAVHLLMIQKLRNLQNVSPTRLHSELQPLFDKFQKELLRCIYGKPEITQETYIQLEEDSNGITAKPWESDFSKS